MLRITADINGTVIDRLFVQNTSRVKGESSVYDAATWDGYDGTFGIEGVLHRRKDPWWMLFAAVAANVRERT